MIVLLFPTGYSNQSRAIASRFSKLNDYNVSYFAWQYWGRPINKTELECGENFDFKILPNDSRSQHGELMLPYYLKDFKPDVLFTLCDLFMIPYFYNINFAPTKNLIYFPSDGRHLPFGSERVLAKADKIIGMSKYACKDAEELGFKAEYIPHAIDENVYFPIKNKLELRQKWGKKWGVNLEDKFILLSVARFQGRKMMTELFKVFGEFVKLRPNSVLVLHSDKNDPANNGVELNQLFERYGIKGRVIFSGMRFFDGFPEFILNELYNLADVHVLTTSGEGFGIPTIESMSCEVPSVITNYTNTPELVIDNKAGIGVDLSTEITGTYNVERAMVDKNKFVEALMYMYDNSNERITMGKNGRGAVLREYSWNKVFPKWVKVIDELID